MVIKFIKTGNELIADMQPKTQRAPERTSEPSQKIETGKRSEPTKKRAPDIGSERNSVRNQESEPDERRAPALGSVFTKDRKGVQVRIQEEVLDALKNHGEQVSGLANRLLTEYAQKEGWL